MGSPMIDPPRPNILPHPFQLTHLLQTLKASPYLHHLQFCTSSLMSTLGFCTCLHININHLLYPHLNTLHTFTITHQVIHHWCSCGYITNVFKI